MIDVFREEYTNELERNLREIDFRKEFKENKRALCNFEAEHAKSENVKQLIENCNCLNKEDRKECAEIIKNYIKLQTGMYPIATTNDHIITNRDANCYAKAIIAHNRHLPGRRRL